MNISWPRCNPATLSLPSPGPHPSPPGPPLPPQPQSPTAPKSGKSVTTFIRNRYEPAKRCEELICAELIRMNKVATDFAAGIADKDLSEELQVRSEQPGEVECKCLAPRQPDWSPL
ncbi:hypothetical protein H1C71_010189 [Ictidomys tridecemlineatus]|nr:hypothetical protein H1C71_010189 [Ictidomys tridecemlineatus]